MTMFVNIVCTVHIPTYLGSAVPVLCYLLPCVSLSQCSCGLVYRWPSNGPEWDSFLLAVGWCTQACTCESWMCFNWCHLQHSQLHIRRYIHKFGGTFFMGPCSAFNGHTCCSYCVADIQTVSLLGKLRCRWSWYGSLLEAFGVVVVVVWYVHGLP